MYKKFYRMQTEAFISLPLPDVFFHSRTHKIAWNYLVYGIKSHEPYLLVAGDYGMGKTLLCLKLVKALQKKEAYPFSYISNSNYSYTTIVREIVKQLGLEIKKEEESSLQGLLYEYFENQKPIQPFYCIIDDVQEFDPMTLVKLRLLANFNHYGVFPIRMIFFAHTSFIERLKSPSMRPLDQRIKRKYSLVPFDLSETKEYIYFRLLNAGAIMSPYFTDNAIEQLFDYTGGIPRLINNICDACLLIGASREMNEIDSSLVEEALEYLGWRSESEDSQEAPYFEEEKEQTTGSDQVVEQMEPDDNEGLDFTNIGSTGVREPETTPLYSKDHKGFLLWDRMKYKIILFLLILIGGFILWLLLQKGISGASNGSTIIHNEIEDRYMIDNSLLEGEKEKFQRDIKGEYSRKELKAGESETGWQRENDSFNTDALNRASPDSPENEKISMVIPYVNIAFDSSEKHSDSDADFKTGNLSHAYSLILSSCRQKGSALKALVNLRRNGFSSLFLGKLNLGKRGAWWVVYMGHYTTWEQARKAKKELRLTEAIIKKIPYANLIGVFSSSTETEDMCRRLKTLGYFPYTIEMEKGMYQLLVGGHVTMKEAKEQSLDLQAVGIQTRMVKR